MANLDYMSPGQAQKEVTFNNAVKALEPSFLYTIKESMSNGLTLYVVGGILLGDGVDIEVADTTLTLVANTTNYVEANSLTGVITVNQEGFTSGAIKLFEIVTNAVTRTSTVNKKPNPLRASTYSLPEATDTILGGVKLGDGLEKIDGKVKPKVDGTTIVFDENGALKSLASGGGSGGAGLTYFKEVKNNTAPNETIPIYSFEIADSVTETNVDTMFGRKGNGSYIFFNVSGDKVAGNKIGRNSVDFTSNRTLATQIVSGSASGGGGQSMTISSNYSFGWGYQNTVSGSSSFAFGNGNVASGISSSVCGYQNTASGDYSTAFGMGNTVSGSKSFAFGEGNTASGSHSYAGGDTSSATAPYSFAHGVKCQSTAIGAFTVGARNINNSKNSIMCGEGGHSFGVDGDLTLGGRWDTDTANTAKGSAQTRIHRYKNRIASASALSKILIEVSSKDSNIPSGVNQFSLVANQVRSFTGKVLMIQENSTAIAEFEIKGLIKRPGTVSTTELLQSTITQTFADATATERGFSVSLSANTTLGCLTITCSTSNYSSTIYCYAKIESDDVIAAW